MINLKKKRKRSGKEIENTINGTFCNNFVDGIFSREKVRSVIADYWRFFFFAHSEKNVQFLRFNRKRWKNHLKTVFTFFSWKQREIRSPLFCYLSEARNKRIPNNRLLNALVGLIAVYFSRRIGCNYKSYNSTCLKHLMRITGSRRVSEKLFFEVKNIYLPFRVLIRGRVWMHALIGFALSQITIYMSSIQGMAKIMFFHMINLKVKF